MVEEYRTTLTGLTSEEVSALFMVNIPTPLQQLGVSGELGSALRKLSASLPESKRSEESLARKRIHLDSSWWFQANDSLPYLSELREAVWNNQTVKIKFRSNFKRVIEQIVCPYGLVAKANIWHLVYAWEENVRVIRVSNIVTMKFQSGHFNRPEDFDLAEFWERWCSEFESHPPFAARVRISKDLVPYLREILGDRYPLPQPKPISNDKDGWVSMDLQFESIQEARTNLLGLGRAVEVMEPEALRKSLVDFAQQVADLYQQK